MTVPSISSSIESFSKNISDEIALIMDDAHLTYFKLFKYAENMASYLQYYGLQKERIALHLPNCFDLAIAYLSCMLTGTIVVPLNSTLKKPEIEYILEHTQPKMLITANAAALQTIHFANTSIERFFVTGNTLGSTPYHSISQVYTFNQPITFTLPKPQDPFAIFYTSGSTGKPKGVTHSHRSFAAMVDTMIDAFDVVKEDRFLVSEAMSSASGAVHLFLPLLVGASAILMTEFNIPEFLTILKHHPTKMSIIGKGNYDIAYDERINKRHFVGIKANFTGGDKVTETLMHAFREKTGVPLRMGYGMTEFLILTINKSDAPEKRLSIGKPGKNVTLCLLNPQGEEVPEGEIGEVCVRGPNCMIGYWEDPENTEAVLKEGWLHTGDLARLDKEGYYWFEGRLKNIIIHDGTNISPFEVEEVLAQHPAVKAVGVVGLPDPKVGEIPVAAVELKEGKIASEEELIAFAKERLESDKVPESIKILNSLPRTRSGKISRQELKALFIEAKELM